MLVRLQTGRHLKLLETQQRKAERNTHNLLTSLSGSYTPSGVVVGSGEEANAPGAEDGGRQKSYRL